MNRYLLFNAGCGDCSRIAQQIQERSGTTLIVRSIAEFQIQQYLNKALPKKWKWEPMVMEVSEDEQDIHVYTGVNLRLRLIQVMGVSKALSIGNLIFKSSQSTHPVEDRRSFLRYGGSVMAGLAVLGLKPIQDSATQVLEFENFSTSYTQLTGQKLSDALTEATDHSDYAVYSSHLMGQGYSESQNTATALLVEMTGQTDVLIVNVPYAKASGDSAMARYIRHGGEIITTMGVVHTSGGTVSRIDAYDVHNGAARHVRTYENRDGTVIERPAPASNQSISEVLNDSNTPNIDACETCNQVCALLRAGSCYGQASLACTTLCLLLGPGAPLCMPICFVLYVVICVWGLEEYCDAICIRWRFCE